jgi:hypothetical protein
VLLEQRAELSTNQNGCTTRIHTYNNHLGLGRLPKKVLSPEILIDVVLLRVDHISVDPTRNHLIARLPDIPKLRLALLEVGGDRFHLVR